MPRTPSCSTAPCGAWCLPPSAPREAIDDAVKLVESFGAAAYFLDADEHDGLVASVSHLPYLMSVALIGHLGRERSWRETASLAAGGFAYATHLTDSDPQMFFDIVRTNRDNIVRRLDLYMDELHRHARRDRRRRPGPEGALRPRAAALHQDWLAGRAQGQTPRIRKPAALDQVDAHRLPLRQPRPEREREK